MSHQKEHLSPTLAFTHRLVRQCWDWLDGACLILSPFALIAFIFTAIIAFDYFGQHVAFLRALADHGVETVGTVAAYEPGDSSFIVEFDTLNNGVDYAFLYTKYYSLDTLKALQDGQRVRVRYTPSEYGSHAVLTEAYGEVKEYTGYLQGLEWVLAGCLSVLAIHPEVVLLGLTTKAGFRAARKHYKQSKQSRKLA